MRSPDPILCLIFLIVAFVMAGFAQTFWLRSRFSYRFQTPLDRGKSIRGKRILGENKTCRGFMVIVPAVGISFVFLRTLSRLFPEMYDGLWSLSLTQYALLGCWTGFGFMAGELPNSFVKRQLGIPPGEPPAQRWAKPLCFMVDRLDSILGGLIALALVVSTSVWIWVGLLIVGPGFHWSFNLLLYRLGVKARPA